MLRSNRAHKLNARAVDKLNSVVTMAQPSIEPDIDQILSDFLGGKPAVVLDQDADWKSFLFIIVLMAFLNYLTRDLFPYIMNICSLLFLFWFYFSVLRLAFFIVNNWVSAFMFPIWFRAPKCAIFRCNNPASYVLNPTGRGETKLCDTHNNMLEHRVLYAPLFRPEVAKSVVAAYQDLAQAAKLDPGSTVIQQNLKQARQLAEIVLERKLE